MSALADRIAEVLRDHVRVKYVDGVPFCECGAEWDINTGHAAHVAERIEAELQPEQNRQLTAAWNAGFKEGMRVRL